MHEACIEVERMLKLNVIEPTNSPWAAPIVLVTKKDGSTRFCVDYRRLNDLTTADVYPLPRCDDLLGSLHGKKYFSALDLESGYWQIPMAEKDKEKTAFVTPFGAWQFNVMPFGLKNAPATFQRTMDIVMAGAKWNHCLIYIDDILIFSETVDDHLKHIKDVFQRLIKYNLKLKPSKCELFKPELLFLGHLISKAGIRVNPLKTKAIMAWPNPACTKDVESFLGLCGYYRKFIKDFSLLAQPLYATKTLFKFEEAEAHAWSLLKHKLANPPLLRHPRPNDPFIVDTDASRLGLGAVLLQINAQGQEQPVEFASRLLRKHEKNYAVREIEALGILWACETFRHWLLPHPFIVRTDHQSLEILDKVEDGRLLTWKIRLRPYSFNILYRRGNLNVVADCLSRSGVDARPETVHSEEITEEMTLFTHAENPVGYNEIRHYQSNDAEYKNIIEFLNSGAIPKDSKSKRERFAAYARKFTLESGLLHYDKCIVLPHRLRTSLLHELHDTAHFGADKLLPSIRARFWWPGLTKDVRNFCAACVSCARASPYTSERLGKLKPIVSEGPWNTVAMDLAGPYPEGEDDEKYVLVVMDHFTKYVILLALQSKKAALVARKVHKRVLCFVGFPRRIITDNGTEFQGEFDKMCKESGIQHSCVLPYHAQANGLVERYMQNLNKMVRIVTEELKTSWSRALAAHAFAYNTSYHVAIMNTPYFLNFGCDPRIPIDNRIEEGMNEVGLRTFSCNKAADMTAMIKWTARRLQEYQADMKQRYDAFQRNTEICVGDIVFVRKEGLLRKTEMKWSKPCRVKEVDTDGLEVVVALLDEPENRVTVSVQRLRPYQPSELNPLSDVSTPPQESNQPPLVVETVNPEVSESDTRLSEDYELPTHSVSQGSRLMGDIRQRYPPIEAVDTVPTVENGNSASPSAESPPDVRQSHLGPVQVGAESLLPLVTRDPTSPMSTAPAEDAGESGSQDDNCVVWL